jgi:hypothetical protein
MLHLTQLTVSRWIPPGLRQRARSLVQESRTNRMEVRSFSSRCSTEQESDCLAFTERRPVLGEQQMILQATIPTSSAEDSERYERHEARTPGKTMVMTKG